MPIILQQTRTSRKNLHLRIERTKHQKILPTKRI